MPKGTEELVDQLKKVGKASRAAVARAGLLPEQLVTAMAFGSTKKLHHKKPKPTPEQIARAKASVKEARKELRACHEKIKAARKVLNRAGLLNKGRRSAFRTGAKARDFYVWEHDFATLLKSTLANVACDNWSPEELAERLCRSADLMRIAVDKRRPVSADRENRGSYSRFGRGGWQAWQYLFDGLVHAMSERTDMNAVYLVHRCELVADAAMDTIVRRRALAFPKKTKEAA